MNKAISRIIIQNRSRDKKFLRQAKSKEQSDTKPILKEIFKGFFKKKIEKEQEVTEKKKSHLESK